MGILLKAARIRQESAMTETVMAIFNMVITVAGAVGTTIIFVAASASVTFTVHATLV